MTRSVLQPRNVKPRHPKRGVVLITTLLSLILLMGLAVALQTRALATVKVLKRMTASHQEVMDQESLRDLIRPLVGEAMIRFDEDTPLKLNSTPFPVRFNGRDYRIVAQDPGGLVDLFRTPDRTAQALLMPEQFRLRIAMMKSGGRGLPLRQLVARTGLQGKPDWLTTEAKDRRLNLRTLSVNFEKSRELLPSRLFASRQPKDARISAHRQP